MSLGTSSRIALGLSLLASEKLTVGALVKGNAVGRSVGANMGVVIVGARRGAATGAADGADSLMGLTVGILLELTTGGCVEFCIGDTTGLVVG
jgi:predicted Rossmann-fold nucleotide-binding protein